MKDAVILETRRLRGNPLQRVMSRLVLALALFFAGTPAVTSGQESGGSTAAAVAGGALGLASGATLGAVGSMIPCSQTGPGPSCVRWSAIGGGVIAASGGALLGAGDSNRLGDAALGAGYACTTPFITNFCHPVCDADTECGADLNSDELDPDLPWDYLVCNAGACEL